MNSPSIQMPTNVRDVTNFIQYRYATEDDDQVIAALLLRSFLETDSRKHPTVKHNSDRIKELFDVRSRREAGIVVVGLLGREIIGTCSMIPPGTTQGSEWTLDTAYLRTLAVDPRFHGLGLSNRLLTESVQIALNWKAMHIALHVQKGAAGVARVYSQFGFYRDERGDTESCDNFLDGWLYDINYN